MRLIYDDEVKKVFNETGWSYEVPLDAILERVPTAHNDELDELEKENEKLKAAIRKAGDDIEEIQRQLKMNTIIYYKHFVFPLQHIQDELVGAIEDGEVT